MRDRTSTIRNEPLDVVRVSHPKRFRKLHIFDSNRDFEFTYSYSRRLL